jgi:hypothetical protein
MQQDAALGIGLAAHPDRDAAAVVNFTALFT